MRAKSLPLIFILPLIFGFISDVSPSRTPDNPVALVKKIVKDVTYKKAGQSNWDFAKTGLPLNDGDEVKTDSKSLALILFTDGSGLIRVRENSVLNIYGTRDNKKLNKNTVLNKGLIGFDVNKQEDEEFKFTTPTVVASIRGTGGTLGVDDDNTTIFLELGHLQFQATRGNKQSGDLTAGNTAFIDKNGNINIQKATKEDTLKHNVTKMLNTKKVKIRTNHGSVEIEYFPKQ